MSTYFVLVRKRKFYHIEIYDIFSMFRFCPRAVSAHPGETAGTHAPAWTTGRGPGVARSKSLASPKTPNTSCPHPRSSPWEHGVSPKPSTDAPRTRPRTSTKPRPTPTNGDQIEPTRTNDSQRQPTPTNQHQPTGAILFMTSPGTDREAERVRRWSAANLPDTTAPRAGRSRPDRGLVIRRAASCRDPRTG